MATAATRDLEATLLLVVLMVWYKAFSKILDNKKSRLPPAQQPETLRANDGGEREIQQVSLYPQADRPQDPPPHLLSLPQEILDMVFDYVYPPVIGFTTISRHSWQHNERTNRMNNGRDYCIRPFPAPKVHDFLVSKRFFMNAARAYIGNQEIWNPSDYCNASSRHLDFNIVIQFVTNAVIDLHSIDYFLNSGNTWPSLRMLQIRIAAYHFDIVEDKFPWEEEFASYELMTCYQKYHLECLAKLNGEYSLTFENAWRARTTEEVSIWHLNVRKFEALVRSNVDEEKGRRTTLNAIKATNMLSGFMTSLTSRNTFQITYKPSKATEKAGSVSKREPATEMTFDQLPETAEEMIKMLKKDGKKVMDLIISQKTQVKVA